jgi:hypothetical protein
MNDACVTAEELAVFGIMPEDVFCRCPHAVELIGLDGERCWPLWMLLDLLSEEVNEP